MSILIGKNNIYIYIYIYIYKTNKSLIKHTKFIERLK